MSTLLETTYSVTSSANSYTIVGLTPGVQYLVRIKSHNLVGESVWTS